MVQLGGRRLVPEWAIKYISHKPLGEALQLVADAWAAREGGDQDSVAPSAVEVVDMESSETSILSPTNSGSKQAYQALASPVSASIEPASPAFSAISSSSSSSSSSKRVHSESSQPRTASSQSRRLSVSLQSLAQGEAEEWDLVASIPSVCLAQCSISK